jgi:hypothetical protein
MANAMARDKRNVLFVRVRFLVLFSVPNGVIHDVAPVLDKDCINDCHNVTTSLKNSSVTPFVPKVGGQLAVFVKRAKTAVGKPLDKQVAKCAQTASTPTGNLKGVQLAKKRKVQKGCPRTFDHHLNSHLHLCNNTDNFTSVQYNLVHVPITVVVQFNFF